MGKEISSDTFTDESYREFKVRLAAETDTLLEWAHAGKFADSPVHIGQEIEACIIDENYLPVPINQRFLDMLQDPCVTEELAGFNIEFNPPAIELKPGCISEFRQAFIIFMQRSFIVAEKLGVRLLMTGILPTVTPSDLVLSMMSSRKRYHVFINRFAAWKKDDFCTVNIVENDGLRLGIGTILMEAVTTSQQVHLQVTEQKSAAYYNTAQVLAGPLLAMAVNSPFFLGCRLWAETRVPLFEQIVAPRFHAPGDKDIGTKDFFGSAYVDKSLLELFVDNRNGFAVLLPELNPNIPGLAHVNLHNGTIWRWNRPVLGEDTDGNPTLRIEHRSFPSGPSNFDMCANLAMLVGTTIGLAEGKLGGTCGADVERMLPFRHARDNFYACARNGLQAEVMWFDGKRRLVRELLINELLPLARQQFQTQGMLDSDMEYLNVIEHRLANGNNGAQWQQDYMAQLGGGSASVRKLTAAYWRRQVQGLPVHMWE